MNGLALIAALSVVIAQVEFDHMSGAGQDIRRTDIGPGIYQFMTMRDSYVRQLNSVVVVNDDDVLVFDTNTRPSSARLILAEIRKLTPKPVRFVVNSHGHPDHWSGNEVYADAFPGVQIIATEVTAQFMHRMADVWAPRFRGVLAQRRAAMEDERRSGKRADGTIATPAVLEQDENDLRDYGTLVGETNALRRVFPTRTFDRSLTFVHGGREFRFMSVTGDAEGTAVLYLPKERVLITGDAVSYPVPYVSSKPRDQAAGLRMLNGLDATVIIPGHGPAFHDKTFLQLELALIETVEREVAEAQRNGVRTLEALQKTVTADALRDAFAHGDSDLEARFRSRVSDLVGFALAEQEARASRSAP